MFSRWLYQSLLLGALAASVTALAQTPPAHLPERERHELAEYLHAALEDDSSFADIYDAQVWIIGMGTRLQRFMPDPAERVYLLNAVHREATRAGLKPDLVLAVMEVESRFDRYAVSSAGAQGLMQVMPFWKNEIGRPDDNLTDIDTNLRYGCHILRYYLDREKGHLSRALARYNGSLGKTWYPERVMVAWEKRWFAGD